MPVNNDFQDIMNFIQQFGPQSTFGNFDSSQPNEQTAIPGGNPLEVSHPPDTTTPSKDGEVGPQDDPTITDPEGKNLGGLLEAIGMAMVVFGSNDPGATFAQLQGQKLRDAQIAQELSESQRQFADSQAIERERINAQTQSDILGTAVGFVSEERNREVAAEEGEKNRAAELLAQESNEEFRLEFLDVQLEGELDNSLKSIAAEFRGRASNIELTSDLASDETFEVERRGFAKDLTITYSIHPDISGKLSQAILSENYDDLNISEETLTQYVGMLFEAKDQKETEAIAQMMLSAQFPIQNWELVKQGDNVFYQPVIDKATGLPQFRPAGYEESLAIAGGANPNEVGKATAKFNHAIAMVDENLEVKKDSAGNILDTPTDGKIRSLPTSEQLKVMTPEQVNTFIEAGLAKRGPEAKRPGGLMVILGQMKDAGLNEESYQSGKSLIIDSVTSEAINAAGLFGEQDIARLVEAAKKRVDYIVKANKTLSGIMLKRNPQKFGRFFQPFATVGGAVIDAFATAGSAVIDAPGQLTSGEN